MGHGAEKQGGVAGGRMWPCIGAYEDWRSCHDPLRAEDRPLGLRVNGWGIRSGTLDDETSDWCV
jgi:hypothetical protein